MGINPGHNGSVAFLIDGELAFYIEEERLSRMKTDGNPFRGMLHILINHKVDELVIGGTSNDSHQLPWTYEDAYTALVRKFNPGVKVTKLGHMHHVSHAATAFYNSGFETAAAVVIDGAGSFHQESIGEGKGETGGFETESIYSCAYPLEFKTFYKRLANGNTTYFDNGVHEYDDAVTITKAYEAVSHYLGFGFIEAGKTMGLAPYGQYDENIPPFFVNGKGNKNLLRPMYPAGALIDEDRFPYLKRYDDPKEWHKDFLLVHELDKNIAFHIQQETEERVAEFIQKAIDLTGETNIVFSGGYALNCVNNYKLKKKFPNVNLYIDPIAHDGGTAIGLAKIIWYQHTNATTVSPLKSLYLGTDPDYTQLDFAIKNIPNIQVTDTTPEEIAQLLVDQNIVTLFQGRSEAGPRALGNRSILFDPRAEDGKEIVNNVKKREWFRPFAGSVLEENVNEWFDMADMLESPAMMYAVDVLPEQLPKIPAIAHVDGTCRVQTVNKEQNPAFYELISAFRDKTDIPILMNTSFNLAGDPLVETVLDAIVTVFKSEIEYLYLPDIGKLVSKLE